MNSSRENLLPLHNNILDLLLPGQSTMRMCGLMAAGSSSCQVPSLMCRRIQSLYLFSEDHNHYQNSQIWIYEDWWKCCSRDLKFIWLQLVQYSSTPILPRMSGSRCFRKFVPGSRQTWPSPLMGLAHLRLFSSEDSWLTPNGTLTKFVTFCLLDGEFNGKLKTVHVFTYPYHTRILIIIVIFCIKRFTWRITFFHKGLFGS